MPNRLTGALGALAAALVLSSCATASPMSGNSDDGYFGAVLDRQYVIPDVTLTSTAQTPYNLKTDTTAPLTLLFFGYTNCPDICGAVMGALASTMTRLTPEQQEEVRVLFITTDPARDTPAVLRKYLDRYDSNFEGLTGPLPTITAAAKQLGVFIEKGAKLPSGGYEVTHGTQVIAIDAADRSPIVWTEGTSPAEYTSDLTSMLADPLEDK